MTKLVPKYSLWEAIQTALAIGTKALQENRDLARMPGPPGRDGMGIEDLDVVETEMGVMIRFMRGDVVKEWRLPIVTDRGVFKEGHTYRKGDGVTWGGSFWIAQDETTDKPDTGKGWRLAVKKGRDGRDGKDGNPPTPAAPVKVG